MNRIIEFAKNNYYLLSSFFIFLSFPSYDMWLFKGFPFFAWISLVPLFLYVRQKKIKRVYLASFATGLAGFFMAYEWIGHFGANVPGGSVVILAFLIPSLSVFFALKITAAELLSRRFEKLRLVIFPSVWIIIDWIESIGFIAFPWPYWGYSQYPVTPIVQMASVTGIMGITFFIVLFNYVLSDFIRSWKFKKMPARDIFAIREIRPLAGALGAVVIIFLFGTAVLLMNDKPLKRDLRIAMVQSCISPWENWNVNRFAYLEELKRYTQASLAENPDFLIWSESATLETISFNYDRGMLNDFEKDVFAFVQACDKPLLTGEIGVAEEFKDGYVNRYPQNNAVLINRAGEVAKTYPKIHLVPFGEWFPYEKWFPIVKRLVTSFGGSSFVPGDRPVLFGLDDKKFGCLICYEGIFHRLCRTYKNLGADFLINITNDGWTHTYKGHMQHFSASVFRAAENGIWYLRAGNTGFTAVIDPYGRVRSSIPILKKGFLVDNMDFSLNHRTVYSITGDLFLYFAMGFIIILSCIYFYEKIRSIASSGLSINFTGIYTQNTD